MHFSIIIYNSSGFVSTLLVLCFSTSSDQMSSDSSTVLTFNHLFSDRNILQALCACTVDVFMRRSLPTYAPVSCIHYIQYASFSPVPYCSSSSAFLPVCLIVFQPLPVFLHFNFSLVLVLWPPGVFVATCSSPRSHVSLCFHHCFSLLKILQCTCLPVCIGVFMHQQDSKENIDNSVESRAFFIVQNEAQGSTLIL